MKYNVNILLSVPASSGNVTRDSSNLLGAEAMGFPGFARRI